MAVSNQQQQRQHILLLVLPVLACAAVVGYQVGVMAWRRKRKQLEEEGGSSAYVLVLTGSRLHQSLGGFDYAWHQESDKVYSESMFHVFYSMTCKRVAYHRKSVKQHRELSVIRKAFFARERKKEKSLSRM